MMRNMLGTAKAPTQVSIAGPSLALQPHGTKNVRSIHSNIKVTGINTATARHMYLSWKDFCPRCLLPYC
jgi:hypothetical protein